MSCLMAVYNCIGNTTIHAVDPPEESPGREGTVWCLFSTSSTNFNPQNPSNLEHFMFSLI